MRVKHLSTLLSLKLPARCLVQSPLSPGRETSRLVISPHRRLSREIPQVLRARQILLKFHPIPDWTVKQRSSRRSCLADFPTLRMERCLTEKKRLYIIALEPDATRCHSILQSRTPNNCKILWMKAVKILFLVICPKLSSLEILAAETRLCHCGSAMQQEVFVEHS